MKRPPMQLYGKIVLPTKRVHELARLAQQVCLTDLDNQKRTRRVRHIFNVYAMTPIWSFVRTISEAAKTIFIMVEGEKVKRVKCVGLFKCRQTGQIEEHTFYQKPDCTVGLHQIN